MISMNDIYYKVDSAIVDQDFWGVGIEGKKQLIDSELKEYISSKIKDLGGNITLLNEKNISVNDLLRILARIIPKEKHFDTLRHFTHYIVNLAGSLQNYSICWWVEEDANLIDRPVVEFKENGLWSELKTHKETDHVKTFDFVYDIFTNNFMKKNNSIKRLSIKKIK